MSTGASWSASFGGAAMSAMQVYDDQLQSQMESNIIVARR